MKMQLIERAIQSIQMSPEKAGAGHRTIKSLYEKQAPFNGWDKYKAFGGWALCHYDSQKIIAADEKSGERRALVKAIRYALHRWSTEEQRKASGADPKTFPKEVSDVVKQYKGNIVVIQNGGALGFATKWDVDPMDPAKVYVRGESMEQQWEDSVEAKELPIKK